MVTFVSELLGWSLGILAIALPHPSMVPFSDVRVAQSLDTSLSRSVHVNLAMEQVIHEQINQYRMEMGLAPLALNEQISLAARFHSQNMAAHETPFGHEGFTDRIEAIARELPYRSAAENVAFNQGHTNPANRAVMGWIASENHRNNIEGNFSHTGIGVAINERGEYFFTQIFILSR